MLHVCHGTVVRFDDSPTVLAGVIELDTQNSQYVDFALEGCLTPKSSSARHSGRDTLKTLVLPAVGDKLLCHVTQDITDDGCLDQHVSMWAYDIRPYQSGTRHFRIMADLMVWWRGAINLDYSVVMSRYKLMSLLPSGFTVQEFCPPKLMDDGCQPAGWCTYDNPVDIVRKVYDADLHITCSPSLPFLDAVC